MDIKKIGLGLAGLAVGFVAGYGAGRVSTGTPINPLAPGAGGYQAGYDAARKKLAESGLFPPAPTELRSLTGTVTEIKNSTITLSVDLRSLNPLEEIDAPKERRVTVTEDTKISRRVVKTPEELREEFAAREPGTPPPSPFKRIELKLEDLKAGDIVAVSADKNILSETSFEATEITVESR